MSSSPVAVAASDPGGNGEPKQDLQPKVVGAAGATAGDGEGSLAGSSGPAGDADVTMMESVEEAPVVAEVKVEGKAVVAGDAAATADVVLEGGGAAAASDLLYATESAGMVSDEGCGDKSVDGTRGLDGGDGGEEKLEAEAGVLQSEAERKLAPAEDVAVAVAVAGEAVEAPGSATTEHAEAESNKPEENYVNATPAIGNKGKGNGVAHCDKEIQNNVLSDVEGSSKIHEDDGTPTPEQQDDRSEMLPPTWEKVPDGGNNQSSNDAASPANFDQCARYCLPPLDKGGFRFSDLVWGKVKSHPWWPGEIFAPSDASELALKHQKKGNHLVAYFGDNTFAWCDESQLKPFVTNYSQMEKQSSSDAFVSSVNYALEELSRRILSGMSCSCLPEELSDNGMSYMVENAGLKDGVTCSAVNRSEILTCLSPENLLHYIKSLALFPGQGGDLLELVIACSQLTSFYRSKGCPELASFQTGSAWVENGMDTSSIRNVMVEEAVTNEVHPSHDKPKRGRGRPRKQKPEDDLELMDKKATSNLSNDTTYDDPVERQMVMNFDNFDDLQNKKKRGLDSFEDSETKSSTTTFGSSFKIGECIRRAASQLTGSSSIVKSQSEQVVYKNTAEAENGEFDISSDDDVNELTVEKRAKRRRMHRHHIADPKELLSQLCSVAIEPMNGYSFSAVIISYFSDYRNYIVSTTTEANIIEKSTAKKGRKRKVFPSPDVETTDHMQDSYWSGLSLHNHPILSLRGASTNTRPRRRRRASTETNVPSVQHLQPGTLGPKKQIQVIERSIIHVDEKMVDECKPTALVLSFGRSTALPSETGLVKMFGRYGPLKESETEVHKNTNTVKVVFKKRADAERAFSAAGKYGTFGPSLRSYRLVNMPFSLGLPEGNNPEEHPEDHGLEVHGPREPKVPQDVMQVDQVDKTDNAEAVKESSAEQVETVKQTCQAEAADKALVDQVDMVEKTGQIDAELTGRPDQIGTDTHSGQAETIAEESSEQVRMIEQAYTQDEASLKDRSEIALSGAATGASNGGTVDEIQLGKAPNQESVEVPSNTLQMEASSEAQTEDIIKQASHAEATNEESAEVLSDTIQVDVVAEAPKQGHVCGDNAVFFEAFAKASIVAQVDTVEQTVQEASAEVPASTMQDVTVPETLQGGHVLSDALQFEVQAEEATHVVGVIEQAREEPLNGASKDVTVADTENEVPEETSVSLELQAEVLASTMQAVTVPETLQGGHVLSDALQFKVQAEEAAQVVGVIEKAREEPLNGASKDVTEADTENEVPEETSVSLELQAEVPASTMQAVTVPETLQGGHVLSDALQFKVQAEEAAQVVGVIEQAREEPLNGASKDVTVAENEIPEETSVSLELQAEVPASTMQAVTVPETLQGGHVLSDALQFEVQAEEAAQVVGVIEQAREEPLNGASKDVTEADTENEVPEETSVSLELQAEVPASTMQAVTVPETLQGGHVLSDALQFKVQAEEAAQVVGVIEQARGEPLNGASKDVTEADTENEVPEETSVSLELQAQSFTEKPGEQDATEQTMQFQAPKEPAEIPCDPKLEVEAVTAEPVGQVTTEQVKVPMEESTTVLSDAVPAETSEVQGQLETVQFQALCETSVEQEGTNLEADTVEDLTKASAQEAGSNKQIVESKTGDEVSAEQVCSVEQTVQVEAVTEASGGQIEVGKQIAGDVAMVDATTNHAVMVEGAVESKVEERVDETVENKAAGETLAGEAAESKTTAEAPDERMENKATAEALSVETGEGETTADVLDGNEKTDNKATAEALAGETSEGKTTAEASDEGDITVDKTVENATVEAPDEKTTTDQKIVEDATVETPDVKTTTAEKAVEDATVETTIDEKAVEDATVETKTAEKAVEDASVEAPDVKITTAEKDVEDATVEAPDVKTTTAEKAVEDAAVEAPDVKTTTAKKTVEDAMVETTTAEKAVEDATVEAPEERTTAAEKDATVEARD